MSIGYYRKLTDQDMLHYLQNKNAFIILALRESVLSIPTHYAYYYDYPDSSIALREGYKEAIEPFNLTNFSTPIQELYIKQKELQNELTRDTKTETTTATATDF
jgi:hypothetical protein